MSHRNVSTDKTALGTRLQQVLAVGAAAKRVHLPHSFVPVDVVRNNAQLLSNVNLSQPDDRVTFKPMGGGDDVGVFLPSRAPALETVYQEQNTPFSCMLTENIEPPPPADPSTAESALRGNWRQQGVAIEQASRSQFMLSVMQKKLNRGQSLGDETLMPGILDALRTTLRLLNPHHTTVSETLSS